MRKSGALGLLLMVSVFAVGCNKQFIPNTEIIDSDINREIINFCERYRHAVEDLNVPVLMSLASERYFDNGGTPSTDDDVDRAGLEKVLMEQLSDVEKIRFEIKYRDVFVQDQQIFVQFTYTMSFQFTVDGEPRWHNYTGDKRLTLERGDNGDFVIVSGM